MSTEGGSSRLSSCLLCLFFILIISGSCDAWGRRRRRRRAPPPPPPPDTTAPTFTYCPNEIGNQYTTSTPLAVSWRTPTASDDRGSATISITSGSGPGSTFSERSHSTTYTARDSAGNQATCTVSFTVVVIRCTALSAPTHGSITCSNSANVDSRCTYHCLEGYRSTSGGAVTRTCSRSGNSGQWSGSALTCVRISCTTFPVPSNGQASCSDSTYYNSRCSVTCNEGYTLQGSSTRWCHFYGVWSGSNPSCADVTAPVFTSCPSSQTVYALPLSSSATVRWPAPTVSDNSGETIHPRRTGVSRTLFSEGTHAIAYVAEDSSGNEASCLFSVTVAVIRCSVLSASTPLQVTCPNGAIRGSICTYSCGTGYRLQGQKSTECQKRDSAGSWSQQPPTCQILQCPSLLAPSHGRIIGACSRNYGSTCNFACDTGYEISNSAQQCNARARSTDAFWEGSTPTCTRIKCRKPGLSTALQITPSPACPTGDLVPSGNQCVFFCSTGYYLTGNAALTCLHNRTWNHPAPTCHLITCAGSDLHTPVNGEKRGCSSARENYGAVCTLGCNVGYLPATPIQRTCSDDSDGNGIWAGPDLTCTIVTCPEPASPGNGRVNGCLYQGSSQAIAGRQKYSTSCSLVCSQGFTKAGGSSRRVCQANGQWDGQQIVCEDMTPPVFVCPSDKRLFAGEDSTSASVPWSDWEPVMGTDRGSSLQAALYVVDSVEVGSAKPSSLSEGTHRVVYRGTDLAGHSAICSFDIEVQVTRCPPIPIPEHGSVALVSGTGRCEEGPVLGADCRVACERGYRLSSDTDYTDRICQRLTSTSLLGYWTGQNKICNVKNCTVPAVTNGHTADDCSRPKVAYGTNCVFFCEPGFTSPSGVDSVSRTCQADETWSGQDIQCTVIRTCPATFDVDHGSVHPPECESADVVRFGTRCEFSCDEGYQIQGPAALACSTEGEWNHDQIPHCEDIQPPSFHGPCPRHVTVAAAQGTLRARVNYEEPVPADNSGRVNLTSFAPNHGPGSVFQEGDTSVGYLATDSSGLSSRCDLVITVQVYRCLPQQPPLHGTLEGCPDPFHGCQCQFSCDVGYDLIGEDTVSCDLSPDNNPVWSHDRPVCQIRTCPLLVIQAPATLTGCGQFEESVSYGSVCTFHCPFGYEGVGEREKRCQADRSWTTTDFVCHRKSCPSLEETSQISIRPESCLSDPRYEDTCTLTCRSQGFEITPSSLRETTCSGNQTWTKDAGQAQCVDIEAPTFDICPSDIVAYTERGLNQTNVQWVVQASDNSGINPQVTCDFYAGVMTSGRYAVTCTARDETGNENFCRFSINVIVRTCLKAFEPPLFGTLTGPCDRSHGSVCHLTCLVGYSLVGSAEASCEFNGIDMYWKTDEEPYCQVNGCDPLAVDSSVSVSPLSCGLAEKVHAGTTCTLHCDHDRTLVGGLESLTCLETGQWSSGVNASSELRCLDLTAPTITSCPSQPIMAVRTEFWGVEVTFDLPAAADNFDDDLIMVTDPNDLTSPYNFTADTACSYSFTDQSNNTATCLFQVYITNNIQPLVQFCPLDQNITTSTKMTEVIWDDPIFLAPPGIDIIETCNYGNNPAMLPWGHHVILYQASDSKNGLKAECRINIDITPVPCHNLHIPAHGALACDDGFAYGHYCTMVCNEGFDVPRLRSAEAPKKLFICGSSGVWYPHASIPDCSQRRRPRSMNLPLSMMYFEGKCGAGENQTMEAISEKFVSIISQTDFAAICTKNELCKVDHVKVTCGTGNYRRKRDVVSEMLGDHSGGSGVALVNMVLSMALQEDLDNKNQSPAEIMYSLAKHIHHHTKNSLFGGSGGITDRPSEENLDGPLIGVRSGINEKPREDTAGIDLGLWFDELVSECDDGYIPDHNRHTCIACPPGHYFHQPSRECVECEMGFYQDEQAQSQCKPCLDGTSTRERGARNAADCDVQCMPGYFSSSGFAPCIPCEEGQFLQLRGHTRCFDCPPGLSSLPGSTSAGDCQEPCPPGMYSSTGFQPCS